MPYFIIILNSVTSQRIRMLYKTFDDKNNNQRFELKKETYDRITASQSLKLGNNIIDIGHAFYGLDCLLHTSNSEHPAGKPAKPFRNSLPTEGFDIQHSIDFTSFIGDLASVIGSAYLEKDTITTTTLDYYYDNRFFSSKDQLGDIDIIGLKKAWDKVSSINPNFKFSDVIDFYYGAITNNHHPIIPEHHSKRFTHFAKYYGLIDNAGMWYGNITPEMQNIKAEWQIRVRKFAVFYYASKPIKSISLMEIILTLINNGDTINISNYYDGFLDIHIEYIVNKFIIFLKEGYDNEVVV